MAKKLMNGNQAIALGALAALLSALLHAPLWLQLVWFFVVSVAALALTRPLVKKYVNSRVKPTNADMILGKECVVTEEIDNIRGTGAVSVSGKVWAARMENDADTAAVGEVLLILRIEGVKRNSAEGASGFSRTENQTPAMPS